MSQNTSGQTQLDEVYKMPGTEVSLLIIMFVATISGTFGNILVINAVFRTKVSVAASAIRANVPVWNEIRYLINEKRIVFPMVKNLFGT